MPTLANYTNDATDYNYAVNFLIQQRVIEKKIKELGFQDFTAEEEAAFASEAETQWAMGLESYVSYYQSEEGEEARAAMLKQAEEFFLNQGFSREGLAQELKDRASIDRLSSYLVGDYEPSEVEIAAAFQQFGAQYQQNYENDILAYEYSTIFGGQESWYTPSGYRGITHILLKPDEALLSEYHRLQSAYEEQQSSLNSEATDPEPQDEATEAPAAEAGTTATEESVAPVTLEQVEAARQAILDSRKAEIDSIFDRLSKGESFESLIKEKGEDPGMQDENMLATGYSVDKDSIAWDPVFTAAAFSDKMQKLGDVSDPVVGTYGIHILHYLRDVPSGLIMSDSLHQELVDFLKSMKEGEAFNTAYAEWIKENEVVLDDLAIQAASDAAKATEPDAEAPELEDLQALPEQEAEQEAEKESEAAPEESPAN